MSSLPVRVWAPNATNVDLVLVNRGRRVEMSPTGEGWFESPQEMPEGTDYGFSLDGGPVFPDPRSAYQPEGPHGPSRAVDLTSLEWSDWEGRDALGALIYELHVGTFTPEGTFDSAIEKLDHLAELGVGIVELMPIAPFPGNRGWGYDGVGMYAVHEAYGGPLGLARFINAAHERGMGVCLDVVYNHQGPDGNYLNAFGPYFTDKHETPWGTAVNYDDAGCEGVRDHVINSVLRWFELFHVDALRLDAIHEIYDDSPRHILAEMSDRVRELEEELGRPLRLIAESDLNDVKVITPTKRGGYGIDMQWADDVHHAIHSRLTGEEHGYYADFGHNNALDKVLTKVFFHDGTDSTFRRRPWGKPVPDGISGHRFVVYDQNHDQVGNRAIGDRPSNYLADEELAVSQAILLTSPYTPMLFQGQEWGTRSPFAYFTDHNKELGWNVSQGRINEFKDHGWEAIYGHDAVVPDPQALSTFEESKLPWNELGSGRHSYFFEFTKRLVKIGLTHPDFSNPDRSTVRIVRPAPQQAIIYRGNSAAVFNLSGASIKVPIEVDGEVLLSWREDIHWFGGYLTMPGTGVTLIGPRQTQ